MTLKIGFLGLGKMGSLMARRLIAAGHDVTVWNRTPPAAEALAAEGAAIAKTPTEAARSKDAIVSMLFDDAANEEVLLSANGSDGAIAALDAGALHIACSTISVALSERLAQEHALRRQQYVAAPVFGRPNVAAEGRLWIVVAGTDEAVAKARPILEPLSRGISVAGSRPSQAHAVKLAGNFLITMMIQSLSEAVVFAKASGIDPATMLETVNSALFQSPFYAAYSKVMLEPPAQPGATIALGVKDLKLFLEAAEAGKVRLAIAESMADRFADALAAGLARADWPSGMLASAELAAHR
ncbi:NAD(P)-dependent oxidoreductase [Acidicapsa acidisoli]|uniref:NAD(P)-dependent oxidoreductase n=1 Tax=Acidicapsa acidisoli TaxID=1615681 RepID=UPI0021E00517|nr:NAD(P)-dependent oxidoreductase [Acidicapsa acidisoli]